MAEIKKRLDLLGFQRSLSNQFLAIVEEDKHQQEIDESSLDSLGVALDLGNLQAFIPLENLKTIAAENRFEKTLRTKSWLTGFNQERGEVYTIYDLEKTMKLISTGQDDFEAVDSKNKQVVYLRDINEQKQAFYLYLDNNSLQYTAEYTKIFSYQEINEESYSWELSDEIDFDSFIQESNMSPFEWAVLSGLKDFVQDGNSFNQSEFVLGNSAKLFMQMVKDVYLDGLGVRPIFIINTDNLTRYLNTLHPF